MTNLLVMIPAPTMLTGSRYTERLLAYLWFSNAPFLIFDPESDEAEQIRTMAHIAPGQRKYPLLCRCESADGIRPTKVLACFKKPDLAATAFLITEAGYQHELSYLTQGIYRPKILRLHAELKVINSPGKKPARLFKIIPGGVKDE